MRCVAPRLETIMPNLQKDAIVPGYTKSTQLPLEAVALGAAEIRDFLQIAVEVLGPSSNRKLFAKLIGNPKVIIWYRLFHGSTVHIKVVPWYTTIRAHKLVHRLHPLLELFASFLGVWLAVRFHVLHYGLTYSGR